jgi:hypothetical protein
MFPESAAVGIIFGILSKLLLKAIGFNGKGSSGIRKGSLAHKFKKLHHQSCQYNMSTFFATIGKSSYISANMICVYFYFSFMATFYFINMELVKFLAFVFTFVFSVYTLDVLKIDTATVIVTGTITVLSAIGVMIKLSQLTGGDKDSMLASIVQEVQRDVEFASAAIATMSTENDLASSSGRLKMLLGHYIAL